MKFVGDRLGGKQGGETSETGSTANWRDTRLFSLGGCGRLTPHPPNVLTCGGQGSTGGFRAVCCGGRWRLRGLEKGGHSDVRKVCYL